MQTEVGSTCNLSHNQWYRGTSDIRGPCTPMPAPPQVVDGQFTMAASGTVSQSKLKWMHLGAGGFMLFQLAGLFAAGLKTKVPQTVNFLDDAQRSGPVGVPELTISYRLEVIALIGLFVALAGFDHLITAVIAFKYPQMFQNYIFVKKTNPLRWAEYSVSASAMSVLLAALAGIYDVHTLFLIGGLTGVCMVIGGFLEAIPKDKDLDHIAKGLFWVASLCLTLSILPMLCYFFSDVGNIPGFVYAAYLLTFVMYSLFAINMYLYRFTDKYDFERAEYIYIILSFTAKTFLAWDVFGGFKASED